jgi:hypothetical protein
VQQQQQHDARMARSPSARQRRQWDRPQQQQQQQGLHYSTQDVRAEQEQQQAPAPGQAPARQDSWQQWQGTAASAAAAGAGEVRSPHITHGLELLASTGSLSPRGQQRGMFGAARPARDCSSCGGAAAATAPAGGDRPVLLPQLAQKAGPPVATNRQQQQQQQVQLPRLTSPAAVDSVRDDRSVAVREDRSVAVRDDRSVAARPFPASATSGDMGGLSVGPINMHPMLAPPNGMAPWQQQQQQQRRPRARWSGGGGTPPSASPGVSPGVAATTQGSRSPVRTLSSAPILKGSSVLAASRSPGRLSVGPAGPGMGPSAGPDSVPGGPGGKAGGRSVQRSSVDVLRQAGQPGPAAAVPAAAAGVGPRGGSASNALLRAQSVPGRGV